MDGNEFGRDGILSKSFLVTHDNSNIHQIVNTIIPENVISNPKCKRFEFK